VSTCDLCGSLTPSPHLLFPNLQRNNFLLTDLNVHRVVITSIMLAAKFFDDQYFNNAYYAKVGGVPPTEMNSLEVEFLFRINFSLHVTPGKKIEIQFNSDEMANLTSLLKSQNSTTSTTLSS
jgi:hypothetical protein